MSNNQKIIFYDGVCFLCDGLVKFVLKYEITPIVVFAQLQSKFYLNSMPQKLTNSIDSVVFYDNEQIYLKSSAIVRLLWYMGGYWCFISFFLWLIPFPIRNFGYDLIARFRYNLFGRSNTCFFVPNNDRFISDQ